MLLTFSFAFSLSFDAIGARNNTQQIHNMRALFLVAAMIASAVVNAGLTVKLHSSRVASVAAIMELEFADITSCRTYYRAATFSPTCIVDPCPSSPSNTLTVRVNHTSTAACVMAFPSPSSLTGAYFQNKLELESLSRVQQRKDAGRVQQRKDAGQDGLGYQLWLGSTCASYVMGAIFLSYPSPSSCSAQYLNPAFSAGCSLPNACSNPPNQMALLEGSGPNACWCSTAGLKLDGLTLEYYAQWNATKGVLHN